MKMKSILFSAAIVLLGLLSSCQHSNSKKETRKQRPNILFIMADDHAFQAISAYGGPLKDLAATPNIDRIADNGMIFNQCLVTNSICGPSRATIFTGKYSHKNGFIDNTMGSKFDFSQNSFPKELQKLGYQTAVIGKLHLGGTPTGFNYYDILPGQGSYYNPVFINQQGEYKTEGYATEIITDKTINWLETVKDSDEPFMVMMWQKAPHRPWEPGPNELGMYKNTVFPQPETLFDDYASREPASLNNMSIAESMYLDRDLKMSDQPRRGLNEEQLKAWDAVYKPIYDDFKKTNPTGKDLVNFKYQRYMRDYLACISSVDKGVGKVLDYLQKSGLDKNTIVIYTSDQGFYLGEHGWFDKRWMYKESLNTPLLISWPDVIKSGSVCNDLVSNLDFGETLIDIAGGEIPTDMQGKSMLPVLKGETPSDWRKGHYYHYYEHPSEHNVLRHYGITTDSYKLIHYYYDMDKWELFDLKEDPNELHNVYGEAAYSDVQAELHKQLAALRVQYEDNDSLNQMFIDEYNEKIKKNPAIEYWKLSPEELQKLFKE
nr:sulfatase [uncultured Carboxylicivirga sp.]